MTVNGDDAPLRVLFVTSMHPSTGFPLRGTVVLRLADALRRLGHNVDMFELGVRGGAIRYVRARKAVSERIRATQPDVVHAIFGYSGLAVPRTDVPLVTTFNGDDLNGTVGIHGRTTWKSKVGILVSQWVALRSARCIAISAPLKSRLWISRARDKTVVIRDAIDVGLFHPLSKREARRKLGVPQDDVLVIFPHDANQPTKRLALAKAAVASIPSSGPQMRLWVVNGKPADEMPWYYAAADVLIVTSLREGGPSSVKEALACGLPVVSVSVGDVELFDEVPEAMIRADATPESLAAALRSAVEGFSRPERRSHLPPNLTLEQAARAVVAVYRAATRLPKGSTRAAHWNS